VAPRTRKRRFVIILASLSSVAILGASANQQLSPLDLSPMTVLSADNSLLFGSKLSSSIYLGDYIGQTFPSSPNSLGEVPSPEVPVTLRDVQLHLRAGDEKRALQAAKAVTNANRWGRDRDAAWFVQGLLYREQGLHNTASEAFTKVRFAKGPLARWGAFFEAEQDLLRGKPHVAVRECEKYLKQWPDSEHGDACNRIIARGLAESGRHSLALEKAKEYDKTHPKAPITEQVELRIATNEISAHPEMAIARLQELACNHAAPLTGRRAEELLGQLRARGFAHAVVPTDIESLKSRAQSLRDAGRRHEAWATFQILIEQSADNPALDKWVEEEADVFGWRTREWGFLETFYRSRYNARPTSKDAWNLYRVLSRYGKWNDAADWALKAQSKHRTSSEWRRSHEDVARILLMAKRYQEARKMFDTAKSRGGWNGRRSEFFAAFTAYSGKDYEDALKRFDVILANNRSYITESRYWRSKSYAALEREEEAAADRAWILENDPMSWYATLVNQGSEGLQHNGAWFGQAAKTFPNPGTGIESSDTIPVAQWAPPKRHPSVSAFGLIRWPLEASVMSEVATESVLTRNPLLPPPSYRSGQFYDEKNATDDFRKFAGKHKETWPELNAIYDLSRSGLYEWSGPAFSTWFDGWKGSSRYRSRSDHTQAKSVKLNRNEWLDLFMFTRDHYNTVRYADNLEEREEDPERIDEVLRHQYPLAHARYIWKYSHQSNIDPYLILGLMRQESTYNAIAVSRVGARGAMQIMPKTGHLLADIQNDNDFTAGDLEDPILAVDYGIAYFGLLMKRYDGSYPLAVASYNGGPHNVSSWLQGTGTDMPMDEFVEHIPFRETRAYVKKVVSGYAQYIAKYGTNDALVMVPELPVGNHAEIVDF
jgi:soluble lytic murein transglycosylase-like protein/tetratricopeptide (TPR) repeat protein